MEPETPIHWRQTRRLPFFNCFNARYGLAALGLSQRWRRYFWAVRHPFYAKNASRPVAVGDAPDRDTAMFAAEAAARLLVSDEELARCEQTRAWLDLAFPF